MSEPFVEHPFFDKPLDLGLLQSPVFSNVEPLYPSRTFEGVRLTPREILNFLDKLMVEKHVQPRLFSNYALPTWVIHEGEGASEQPKEIPLNTILLRYLAHCLKNAYQSHNDGIGLISRVIQQTSHLWLHMQLDKIVSSLDHVADNQDLRDMLRNRILERSGFFKSKGRPYALKQPNLPYKALADLRLAKPEDFVRLHLERKEPVDLSKLLTPQEESWFEDFAPEKLRTLKTKFDALEESLSRHADALAFARNQTFPESDTLKSYRALLHQELSDQLSRSKQFLIKVRVVQGRIRRALEI